MMICTFSFAVVELIYSLCLRESFEDLALDVSILLPPLTCRAVIVTWYIYLPTDESNLMHRKCSVKLLFLAQGLSPML